MPADADSGIQLNSSGAAFTCFSRVQSADLARAPNASLMLSYGALKLHPVWDPLRGDPRFEQIVESLAPKERH